VIDIEHRINAVSRHVGSRTLDAGQARTVMISQAFPADQADVFHACTDAERIPRWLMPVSGDLRLGGRYQLHGNAGGEVQECDPPNGFKITWEFADEVSWVEVTITPEGEGRTRLTVEHISHVDDERWKEFGPGAVGIGWDMMVMGLDLHLAAGPESKVNGEEVMAWMATSEGVELMTRSGDEWRRAGIAAGTDPTEADAAAARTIAAYTGQPAAE
jgi:uncharacterized protein YndB with AHSA1/START domain